MASITSLSNSSYNTSSIYGNRNILSGLASGMDTETMIENAVSGIKLKIQNLQKKRTKVEWQQEAYRSIIDKAVNLSQKYTSYSSKTNLMSQSFFSNAVNTTTNGTYKDKVSASGKTSSEIKINAVKQMATAASYTVSGLGGGLRDLSSITGEAFDITDNIPVSTVSGTLTFQYGGTNGTSFDISFGELENLNDVVVYNEDGSVNENAGNTQKLAQAINNKLSEITYNYTKNGVNESTTADKAIKVTANPDGRLTFTDGLGNGNTVKISYSSGKLENLASENVLTNPGALTKDVKAYNYLSDKSLGITFNGSTKTINLEDVIKATDVGADNANESFTKNLQKELDDAFGAGKITASYADGKLSFKAAKEGDTLALGGSAIEALGFESGDTNYVNPAKKLSDILGEDNDFFKNNRLAAVGSVNKDRMTDAAGNRVKLGEDGNYYRTDSNNKFLYDFKVNGASIAVNEDTTLENLMNSINSNAEAGVKVSYSKLTNEFKFTTTETGENSKIEFDGLAKDLFGSPADSSGNAYVKGQDAIMDVEVNGKRFENLTRASNTFDFDGLNVTVKGTFNADGANAPDKDGNDYEAVTFNTTTDSDKIVDTIREFINDYNEMATELKNAYSTLPAEKSNGSRYEPLTAEQEDGYSESELKAYNEKAKQGILFGDSTLSSMYGKLLNAIQPGGTDGQTLREIGISTSYSGGMTTLSLDEDKLRAALESDPDKVKNAFTKTKESGSATDGLMKTLQNTLDTYVKTTGEPKGVLITRAGSVKAPTSLYSNSLKSQLDNYDNQIDRWTDKMADQIDRYTSKFSKLEQLIAEMNSQSSALMGLMGGSSY